jgi:flavin reductase (DIM6/NTAB) family NADH-FMN oxidoreductase RutF
LSTVSEQLRNVMRQWSTGVCVVISQHNGLIHGMTVNSFTSISLDPPLISVTLANNTRTFNLIKQSERFSISILQASQEEISDKFAGKIVDDGDRIKGVDVITLPGGLIALSQSLAWLECKIKLLIPFENSTLILGDVVNANLVQNGKPLIYHNRGYFSL